MHMPGLQRLHASMQQVGISRIQFQIAHNHLTFAGVFLADVSPYELALGAIGHDFVLIFEVDRHFNVLAYIKDEAALAAIKGALNAGQASGHAFNPGQFLREIDAKLPQQAHPANVPSYADVVRVYRYVEEADRVHFVNFKPHSSTSGNHVTAYHLDTTRRLLGHATHDFCKRNPVRSCWSDIAPATPVTPTLPSGPSYK